MISPKSYVRGVFVALAIAVAAPLAGVGVSPLATPAFAQQRDPLISSVLFEGNQGFSDAQLLSMVDSAARGVASQGAIAADAESIRLAYESKGYPGVSVTPRVEPVDNGRVRVTFVINEGTRSGIAAINFAGNNVIDTWTLKSVIRTRESHWLSWLFRDDAYDPQKLAIDKELIRIYYGNRGFPDAMVTSAVAEFDTARNAYFINFTVSEGERYDFSGVGVETSIAGLNADALTGSIRTHAGSRYSLADLERTQEDMAFEATAQGYPFADVRPRINRDAANHTFEVTYLVDEGPRVYIERIDIVGNTKTRDFVIRRELGFAEGDPFNRSMVSRGKKAIEALGFFKTVSVDLAPGSAADKVSLSISVVEDSTGDYGATVGYASDAGVLGEVSITERNFLGRGQYLRAAIGASQTGRSFDFSFTEPRFMGLKVSSGIDVYHRIVDESASNFYGSTATGGQLRFGLPITRDISGTVFFGGETKTYTDASAPFSVFGPSGIADGSLNGVVKNKAWVGYSLVYNTLDAAKNPTEGIYATLTQSYLGWDFNLLKTEAKARYFMPVMDTGMVASVRAQAGAIVDLGGGSVSPLESFQVGPSLVRGFQFKQVGPRLPTGEMLGTTLYAGISGELEFPIPMIPESYGLKGAVWADAAWIGPAAGSVAATATSTDQPFKSSVGASVIWDGPFGPIRGDAGYVISKATDDQTQIFALTIQNLL
jgi:outer membrane protein insertion porin family